MLYLYTCAKFKRNPFLKVCHHFYSNPVIMALKDISVEAGDLNPHSADEKHQSLNSVLLTAWPQHFHEPKWHWQPNRHNLNLCQLKNVSLNDLEDTLRALSHWYMYLWIVPQEYSRGRPQELLTPYPDVHSLSLLKDLLERKCQVVKFAEFHFKCFKSVRKSSHMPINRFLLCKKKQSFEYPSSFY